MSNSLVTTESAAHARLAELLTPDTLVYTTLRHVSTSGMTRWITPWIIVDGKPFDLSWLIVQAGWGKETRTHDGLKVEGCGMDMGFHLVYTLSRRLHGGPNTDGGYALRHQWF